MQQRGRCGHKPKLITISDDLYHICQHIHIVLYFWVVRYQSLELPLLIS